LVDEPVEAADLRSLRSLRRLNRAFGGPSVDPWHRSEDRFAAIELYHKPDFRYREEAFAILALNARPTARPPSLSQRS
jgi:hypothetical protein